MSFPGMIPERPNKFFFVFFQPLNLEVQTGDGAFPFNFGKAGAKNERETIQEVRIGRILLSLVLVRLQLIHLQLITRYHITGTMRCQ